MSVALGGRWFGQGQELLVCDALDALGNRDRRVFVSRAQGHVASQRAENVSIALFQIAGNRLPFGINVRR